MRVAIVIVADTGDQGVERTWEDLAQAMPKNVVYCGAPFEAPEADEYATEYVGLWGDGDIADLTEEAAP